MLGHQQVQCRNITGADSPLAQPWGSPAQPKQRLSAHSCHCPSWRRLFMPTGQTVVIPAPKHVCFLRVTALRGLPTAYLPQGRPSPAPEHGRTTCPIPAPPPCGARRTAPLVGQSQTPWRCPDGPQSSLPACTGQSRSQQRQSGPPSPTVQEQPPLAGPSQEEGARGKKPSLCPRSPHMGYNIIWCQALATQP